MGSLLDLIIRNKEWLFSGVVVVVISAIVRILMDFTKRKHKKMLNHELAIKREAEDSITIGNLDSDDEDIVIRKLGKKDKEQIRKRIEEKAKGNLH